MQNLERRVRIMENRSDFTLKVSKATSWAGTWGGTAIAVSSIVSAMRTEYPVLTKAYLVIAGMGVVGAAMSRINVEKIEYLQHRREGAHIVKRKKIIYEAPAVQKIPQPGVAESMSSPVTPIRSV